MIYCEWVACFPKSRLAGKVIADDVRITGDIKGNKALIEAYELGKDKIIIKHWMRV